MKRKNDETLYGALLNAHVSNNANMNNNHNPHATHPRTNPLMNKNAISGMKSSPVRPTPCRKQHSRVIFCFYNASVVDKGLRHFSAKVSAKVEEKGRHNVQWSSWWASTRNRSRNGQMRPQKHSQKGLRCFERFGITIDIIPARKEGNQLAHFCPMKLLTIWGPSKLKATATGTYKWKVQNLRETCVNAFPLKNLIDRNAELQNPQSHLIQAISFPPFILISAARDCHVHCKCSKIVPNTFSEFNTSFQINEDIELMRLMGLDTGRIERIKSFFP